MSRRSLTDKQARAVAFIAAYTAEHKHSPTYREVGEAIGINSGYVHRMVYNLRARGLITFAGYKGRSLTVVTDPETAAEDMAVTPVGLTPRQRDALAFVTSYIARRGYSPTYREIMAGLGLKSTSGVHRLLHGLKLRGHLLMLEREHRAIFPLSEAA